MIVKSVDGAGRIIIPKKIRDILDMNTGDNIEVFVDGENIIFQKYGVACSVRGEKHDIKDLKRVYYCEECPQEHLE